MADTLSRSFPDVSSGGESEAPFQQVGAAVELGISNERFRKLVEHTAKDSVLQDVIKLVQTG